MVIGVGCYFLFALCLLCCYRRDQRKRRQREEEEEARRRRAKEEQFKDIERDAAESSSKMNKPAPTLPKVVPSPEVKKVIVPLDSPRTTAIKMGLVHVKVEEEKEHAGAVGLLWGGSNDDSLQEMSQERISLKRRSERFTREQLVDVLNQRSFTMPLEKVHEGVSENQDDEDYLEYDEAQQQLLLLQQQYAAENFALADSGIEVVDPEPSAVYSVNIDGMSIKELKSFIVENGGDLTGCVQKEQLLTRAREFV